MIWKLVYKWNKNWKILIASSFYFVAYSAAAAALFFTATNILCQKEKASRRENLIFQDKHFPLISERLAMDSILGSLFNNLIYSL